MSDVTRILSAIGGGDAKAADELLPILYDELRKLATHKMANEAPGQTLQPTALVHEAWLRLVGAENPQFEGRGHFFAAAAEAMRRILIERARQKLSLKRGARGAAWYGEFSTDGRLILTGDDAGNARLWDAASGLPLSDWVKNGLSLKRTHLSPDGRWALSAAEDGTVRVWPVLFAPLPAPAWLPELAEALAGRRLREDKAPEAVPDAHWPKLSASLSALEGEDFYARWARWFLVERMKDKPSDFVP